jgi:hypothetical protein
MTRYTIQPIDAGHDRNGNPRRLYLVVHTVTGKVGAFDEGYSGRHALPEWLWADADTHPRIKVGAGEYRRLLRTYPAKEF